MPFYLRENGNINAGAQVWILSLVRLSFSRIHFFCPVCSGGGEWKILKKVVSPPPHFPLGSKTSGS